MHLVLGGTGGFGSAMVRALLARGERVRVYARDPASARLPSEVEFVKGDAADLHALVDAAKGCDSITHAVNLPWSEWDPRMLHIMDNVVEASGLTGATVVFPGDMVGLKPVSEVPLPVETLPRDANDRPCRKGSLRNMLEDQLHQNADIRNIRTLIVRSGDQFGERSDGWVMGAMFRAALRGEPIPWFVSADVPHVFTWTDDVARVAVGYLLAPSRPVFEIAHVAGHTIPNAETWGRALAAAAGVGFGGVKVTRPWKLRLRGLLDAESREYAELLYLWEAPFFLDDSRTRALLPDWSPTPLDAALQATMAWFRG